MEGFLQAELIENIEGFYTTNNDIVTVDNNKAANVRNFYSEYYLTEKPKWISWYEYLYNIKLNEMLDVKRYELVKIWEYAEYKKLLEEKTIFELHEKKMAYKNAFGDYNLWSQIKKNFSNDTEPSEIYCGMQFGVNISDRIISEIKNNTLFIYSRIRRKILEQETTFNINIESSDNFDINEAIKKYILENTPYEVMDSIKNQYYFDKDTDYLYEYKSGSDKWERREIVKAGKIAIPITEFTEKFRIELKKITNDIKNNTENIIRFNWWAYNEKIIDEKDYKQTLNDIIYDKALKVLNDTEKFKTEYYNLFGLLPHD